MTETPEESRAFATEETLVAAMRMADLAEALREEGYGEWAAKIDDHRQTLLDLHKMLLRPAKRPAS